MDNSDAVAGGIEKYYAIERKNLIHLLKLSVKNLIDYALSLNSSIEEEVSTLYQLFVILEQVLQHGLKEKIGIFNANLEYYNVIQGLAKDTEWIKEILESVDNMSNLKTLSGKGRGMLRVSIMQKKTHTLFNEIIMRTDKTRMFYHSHALLLSEESSLIPGLLTGLNVIDCNLYLKERDLDSLPQVVQLTNYLKEGNYLDTPSPPPSPQLSDARSYQHILEQKSYVEEINEKLRADNVCLEKKCKMLKEDAEAVKHEADDLKSQLQEVRSEKQCLSAQLESLEESHKKRLQVEKADMAVERETYEASRQGLNDLYLLAKEQLATANAKIAELQRDVEVERNIRRDLESANELLEKELQDKDDTITALRKQCSDVKKLNLDMLNQVQNSGKKVAEKEAAVRQLENKTEMTSSQIADLIKTTKELSIQNEDLKKELDGYKCKYHNIESKHEKIQTEYEVEKELKTKLQQQSSQDRTELTTLRAEVMHVNELKSSLKQLHRENDDLRRSCREQEMALIELGDHLSKSKVKAEEMKYNTELMKESKWTNDREIENCQLCNKNFSVARRKHHCRHCGGIFCHQCSDNTMPLPSSSRPLRVCDRCHDILLERSIKS